MGNKQTPAQQSIQAYIKHLKTRKETLNLTGLKCMKYDNIIVTIDQWKKMSQKLLQIQYEYPKYNQRIKKIIQELKIFIENINSEELIKAFQNKQKLEEFLRLDNSEAYPCLNLSEHIQIDQCQLHVQSMIKSTRIKRRILNNINELKKQSKLKNLVEKEILQKDNFIMIIIKKYCQIVLQTFQQINMNELNQETIDHQQSLTFITKFQQKLLTDIYMKEIDPDITLKTIFSYEKIFLHYINFLKCTNSEELKAYEQMLDLKQNLTLSDLGAEQAFWLSEKKDPYSEVVLQLNFIQKQICPVRKFELIGKLKYTICKCLDEYYIQHPMKNQKQLQVDSDHFLIILIYTLIRQNQPTFFIHLKFILFTMSKEIGKSIISHSFRNRQRSEFLGFCQPHCRCDLNLSQRYLQKQSLKLFRNCYLELIQSRRNVIYIFLDQNQIFVYYCKYRHLNLLQNEIISIIMMILQIILKPNNNQ